MPIAFIFRTALTVAILTVVYQETGWATTLLLVLTMLRFEIENFLFVSAFKKAQEVREASNG